MAAIITISTDFRIGTGASAAIKTAGEAISAFELLYLKASDGKLWLSVNSAQESSTLYGIAIQDAAADGFVAYVPATAGDFIESDSALWTKGQTYIVGDTAGQMMSAGDAGAGDYVTVVGTAISTTELQIINSATGVAV